MLGEVIKMDLCILSIYKVVLNPKLQTLRTQTQNSKPQTPNPKNFV